MKNKRGQITVFIIIGLVLAISMGLFFTFQKSKDISLGLRIDPAPIKTYVESCIDDATIPGVYLLASKGGYIYFNRDVLRTENELIMYHSYNGRATPPSRISMQEELSRFIGDSLSLCLDGFAVFDYYDFDVGMLDVETTISRNDVFVKINFPITIRQEGSKVTISDFSASFPIRLGHVLDVKDDIVSKISDEIVFDELSSYDVEVSLLPYDKNNMIYSIYDAKSDVDEAPFLFNFAVKIRFYENMPPVVDDIIEQTAYVDEVFSFKVSASDPEGNVITFRDETALFNVNAQTGELSFTPTPADMGDYEIPIIVSDGSTDVERVLMLSVAER